MSIQAIYNTINKKAQISLGLKQNVICLTEKPTIYEVILSGLNKTNVFINQACPGLDLSLCLTSDPVNTKTFFDTMLYNRINGLVVFGDHPGQQLKKEDIAIIKHRLARCHNITHSESIKNSWPIDMDVYSVGIPSVSVTSNSRKSLVVMSSHNINQAKIIHKQILEVIPDAGLLIDFNTSLDNLTAIVCDYKVCLNLDNYINVIFAMACGCSVVSRHNYGYNNVLTFRDSPSLNQSISDSLKYFDLEKNLRHAEQLVLRYDIETFEQTFADMISKLSQEPFLL
jgi:hypothetical protein